MVALRRVHGLRQLQRGGAFGQQRGGAEAQREDHQAAQAEGEGQRRGAREDVVRRRRQDVPGEGVRVGEDVAVEVHGDLRRPGGARRRAEQRDVVGRGRDVGELAALGGAAGDEVRAGAAPHGQHRHVVSGGLGQIIEEPVVAQGGGRPGQFQQGPDLAGAQGRHDGDDDGAGLEHAEPGRDEPRVVRRAQQHAVPGDEAEVLDEDLGHLVGAALQFPVGPGPAVGGEQGGAVGTEAADGVVDQRGGGVELLRVLQFREGELQRGPLLCRRQIVTRKGVQVRRGRQFHCRPFVSSLIGGGELIDCSETAVLAAQKGSYGAVDIRIMPSWTTVARSRPCRS